LPWRTDVSVRRRRITDFVAKPLERRVLDAGAAMQSAVPTLCNFDELAIGAMSAGNQTDRVMRISDTYAAVEISEADEEDFTSTRQWVRFSAPYERIEMIDGMPALHSAKRTRFVKTVTAPSATMSFSNLWFQPEDAALLDEETVDTAAPAMWRPWYTIVAVSVAIAAAVVASALAY
jgi:hypothetical protein